MHGCILENACYTFVTHDKFDLESQDIENTRTLFTIKIDDVIAFSGSNFHTDRHLMFGASCFGNRHAACSISGNNQDSLFRLELIGDNSAGGISWKLMDVSDNTLHSAGPFEDCSVNTFALCLPPTQCYKFVAMNSAENSSNPTGLFTVLFSGADESHQNYTGDFSLTTQIVYLGSCYDNNFT